MQQAQSSPRTNFEKMRGHAGSLNLILEAVNVGNFLENEAKDFAGKFHENAGGRFIHASSQGNFKFDEWAMKDIFTDFYKVKAYSLSESDGVNVLLMAIKETNPKALAYEIENANWTLFEKEPLGF